MDKENNEPNNTMNNKRPTPKTDEQINGEPCTRFAILAGDSLRDALVTSQFARKLERERDEAREQLEREQMRLVTCDVVAMADTESSRGPARVMHKDYWSAAVESVIRRVDECIELRKQNKAMREAIKEAHAALEACMEDSGELLAEHDWWKDEPRCGHQERYEENKQRIENAKTTLAKLNPFLA